MSNLSIGRGKGVELNVKFRIKFENPGYLIFKMHLNYVAQWVKNPPATQETLEMRIQSLGQEDPLDKGMAAYSSILAWRIL